MLRDSGGRRWEPGFEIGEREEHRPSKFAVLTCILVLMLAARNSPRCSGATPRDPERTRGRLLREVFQEMHAQDFEALTWTSFWPTAGVTKGALYYQFDNKEALGYAVVDEIVASLTREKWVRPLQNAKNPIDNSIRIVQSTSEAGRPPARLSAE